MEISLRSQLAAGIAVAGAAVIAVTPTVHPASLPSMQRVAANIELAAVPWSNPITALGDTLGLLGGYLVATDVIELTQLPGPIDVFTTRGVIPQLLNVTTAGQFNLSGLPLLQAFGSNLAGYAEYGVQALQSVTSAVGGVTFGIPLTAFELIEGLISGDPVNILQAIQTNIIDPVADAITNVVGLTSTVLSDVIDNATTLLTSLPDIVVGVAKTVIGGFAVVGTQLLNVVIDTLGNITNPKTAWNTLVDGLVSPDGVLGSLVKLSVGQGVIAPPNFVPSLRQTLTATTVGGALQLTNPPVAPVAAVRSAAAAKAPRAAAALSASDVQTSVNAEVSTSNDATPATSDSSENRGTLTGSNDPGSEPTASKHRVSRKAQQG